MLQLKQISRVLSQGLNPVPGSDQLPLALSLLSAAGLPLTTVTSLHLQSHSDALSSDTLKIYSLLAVSNFQLLPDYWTLLEFEHGVKAIIEQVHYSTKATPEDVLYVVIFYDAEFSDAIAKLKIDNINSVLQQGLKGYIRE